MNPYRRLAMAVLTQTVLDLRSARAKGLLELCRGRWSLGPAGREYNRGHQARYKNLCNARVEMVQLAGCANSPEFRGLLARAGVDPDALRLDPRRPSIATEPARDPLFKAAAAVDRAYRRWETRRGLTHTVPTFLYGSCN